MKKIILPLAAAIAGSLLFPVTAVRAGAEEFTAGKAAYLCDFSTGTEVYARKECERLPIASMCKIMTLLLTFEAVDEGNLAYDELITVSENASSMGGSQVFLDTGLCYPAEQLIKSVAVCSANDSCVALAERVAGSEEGFVAKMNARAKELGAENTLFANCTGLPKEPQYSCAKDVALMLRALITHEKYFDLCKVWLEDFSHPDGRTTSITNTNKLIRTYRGCDGGKTGFTNEAGFCLAATAKRDGTRLISVVIGAENSKERFSAVSRMFDYAFGAYETRTILEAGEACNERVPVAGSKQGVIAYAAKAPLNVFAKRGEKEDVTLEFTLRSDLKAPIKKGEEVGTARLYRAGVEIASVSLVTLEDAERMSWWEAFRQTARDWQ